MKKLSLIEWLVILTIILIIARPIVWGIWGREINEKERAFFESMGVNYGFVQGGVFVIVFACLVFWGVRDWKRRKALKQRKPSLKLPDE